MRKQKNPSIRQVAKAAGVSIYTVSSVLNNKGDISDKTRDIVLAAVKELDYDPLRNLPLARKTQRTTFGIVLPDIAAPSGTFYYRSIATATALGSELGHEVKIFSQKDLETDEIGYAPEKTRFGCEAFIFFMPSEGWKEQVRSLQQSGVRTAVVGRESDIEGVLHFSIDRTVNIRLAMTHLAECGCRSIGLSIFSPEKKNRGYIEAYHAMVEERGLVQDERLIAARERNIGGDPAQAFVEQMKQGVKIDGILFSADRFAARAVRGFWKAGIRIPEDVMIVGVNDDPVASEIIPALTTVRIPVETMVMEACRELHAYTPEQKSEKHCRMFRQELIVRESTVPEKQSHN